jgi:hypothetical protein
MISGAAETKIARPRADQPGLAVCAAWLERGQRHHARRKCIGPAVGRETGELMNGLASSRSALRLGLRSGKRRMKRFPVIFSRPIDNKSGRVARASKQAVQWFLTAICGPSFAR